MIVFCISSFFAAIAGILYASSVTVAASADSRFSFFSSLLLTTLAISPFREPWYVLPAAIGAVIPAYVHAAGTTDWLNVLFGFFAIVVALTGGPHAMPAALRAPLSNAFSTRRRRTSLPSAVARGAVPKPMRHNDCGPALVVEQLNVTFGGLVAVHNLTMHVPAGRITALIGPNGAGKTTTFNACSGLNRPSAGRILLHGDDVSMLSPAARARRGLGRTLKRMELCDTLSVRENVALGREAGQAGGRVFSQLVAPRREHLETAAAAADAMELCGITAIADKQAGDLSTGQRRLVELARTLAGPFDVLLLDEPSSGLDRHETQAFGEILTNVVRDRGCAILLVEHGVALVMRVCEYMYVLDFGELIFEGDGEAVASSAIVRAAYLGDDNEDLAEMQELAIEGAR